MKKEAARKVLSIVTAATGDHVVIGEAEIDHALTKHFRIPKLKLVEIVEQVLIDPTAVYLEEPATKAEVKSYHLFYRFFGVSNRTRGPPLASKAKKVKVT